MRRYITFTAIAAIAVVTICGCKSHKATSGHMEFYKKTYQAISATKLIEKDTKVLDFCVKDNRILFVGGVNGHTDTVQFDTGVSAPIVQFLNKNNAGDRKFYDYPVTTVEAGMSKIGIEEIDLSFPFYDLHSYSLFYLLENTNDCNNQNNIDKYALVGSGSLLQFGNILKMDFTNSKMELLGDDYVIDTNEYKLVEGHYFQGIPFVKINIEGKTYECIFDTGNQAGILLEDTTRACSPKNSDIAYEGSYGMAASGTTKAQHFAIAPEENISVSGMCCKSFIIYVENVSFNNIGINFIKNYDWILDSQNQKIYAKNRNIDFTPPTVNAQYRTTILDDEIVIINRMKGENPTFEVGDKIESVDGKMVNSETICEIQETLSNATDWNKLDIAIKREP